MASYVKATNFATKDTLASGNPAKIVKGTEIDTEFNAIAAAIASKPDAESPTLTGTPLAPTATTATNNTQIATTAYVVSRITQDIAGKANIASPTFTGIPAAPTATAGTNTTQLATTAFVKTAVDTAVGGVDTGVLTFSGGTTGLTPNTATAGAVVLAGTLGVANGGTGQTTYTNGQLLIGNSTGNTLAKATLTAGTGISITNGAGSITIASSLAADVQTFNVNGTWNKPSSGTMARIQVWGGGGGGGSFQNSGGGGGGGYNEITVPLSTLASSVSVTVGPGGGTQTSNVGLPGGTSSFGTLVYAYGGGGGNSNGGGGGGSQLSAGSSVFTSSGSPGTGRFWDGGAGGATGVSAESSVFGGAGGVYMDYSAPQGLGVSVHGGSGATSSAGAIAPGGGGRGVNFVGSATAGAAGRVIVTVF